MFFIANMLEHEDNDMMRPYEGSSLRFGEPRQALFKTADLEEDRRQHLADSLRTTMRQSSLVPDSEEVTVESVMSLADGQFLLVVASSVWARFLPAMASGFLFHIHSHYLRLLSDLPWEGIPVHIQLHVRRFFCRAEDCEQAIFTERLPHTVLRYARRTCRLSKTIRQITMALGGEGGSEIGASTRNQRQWRYLLARTPPSRLVDH